jgi:hypothetical protein
MEGERREGILCCLMIKGVVVGAWDDPPNERTIGGSDGDARLCSSFLLSYSPSFFWFSLREQSFSLYINTLYILSSLFLCDGCLGLFLLHSIRAFRVNFGVGNSLAAGR